MRLFVYLIIIFDVLVLLTGAFLIFDKFMRRRRPESHYIFMPFEKDSQKGYALYNDEKRYVCYAVPEKEIENNCVIYYFKNSVKKRAARHKISEMLKSKNAPNFSNKSFFFDDKEIWKFIEKMGISIRATIVDDSLTQYKIEKYSDVIGFIRKRKGSGRVYTMRTHEKNIDSLFLVLFAIAKTEEK